MERTGDFLIVLGLQAPIAAAGWRSLHRRCLHGTRLCIPCAVPHDFIWAEKPSAPKGFYLSAETESWTTCSPNRKGQWRLSGLSNTIAKYDIKHCEYRGFLDGFGVEPELDLVLCCTSHGASVHYTLFFQSITHAGLPFFLVYRERILFDFSTYIPDYTTTPWTSMMGGYWASDLCSWGSFALRFP